MRRHIIPIGLLFVSILALIGCLSTATPIVIRDNSAAMTRTALAQPPVPPTA